MSEESFLLEFSNFPIIFPILLGVVMFLLVYYVTRSITPSFIIFTIPLMGAVIFGIFPIWVGIALVAGLPIAFFLALDPLEGELEETTIVDEFDPNIFADINRQLGYSKESKRKFSRLHIPSKLSYKKFDINLRKMEITFKRKDRV